MKKRAPKWSLVFVNMKGKVVDVIRFYEEYPKPLRRLDEYRQQHPDATYFIARPGQYDSLDKLQGHVSYCIGR